MKDPVAVTQEKARPAVAGPAGAQEYRPEIVHLYGVPITQVSGGGFDARPPDIHIQLGLNPAANREFAAIYGFAYEGHCYSLPKPCILVVLGPAAAPVGCGYNLPPGYQMWTADKMSRSALVSVEQGSIEELILSQNIGGSKMPAAYGTRVQIAHRGGKLME